LASYLAGFRITKRNISASILADVKRFFHQINTDEVFGTHNEADSRRQSTQCLPAELQEPDLAGRVHSSPPSACRQ
jgi:dTDP-D-glucose 4,6-dehydratase